MAVIASLNVLLKASADNFQAGMKKAGSVVGDFKSKVTSLTPILSGLQKSLAGLAAGVTVNALKNMTVATLDAVAANSNFANRIGATYNGLQALQLAAAKNGSSAETMNDALQRMTVLLGEAAGGSESAAASLNKINLSAGILNGLAPDRQFALITSNINQLATASERAAAIQGIFGKGAADLGNLLNLTADDFARYASEVNNSAASLSEFQVAEMKRAQDSVEALSRSWESLKTTVVAAAAPTLARELGSFAADLQILTQSVDPTNSTGIGVAYNLATGKKGMLAPDQNPATLEDIFTANGSAGWMNNRTGAMISDTEYAAFVDARNAKYASTVNNQRQGGGLAGFSNPLGFQLFEDVTKAMGAAVVAGAKEGEAAITNGAISATVQNSLRAGGVAFRSIRDSLADAANKELESRPAATAAGIVGAGSQADRLFSFNREARTQSTNPIKNLEKIGETTNDLLADLVRAVSGRVPEFDL